MNGCTHTAAPSTGGPNKKSEAGDLRSQEAVPAIGSNAEMPQLSASKLPSVPERALSVKAVMDLAAEMLWPELVHKQPLESHPSTMVEVHNREKT